jgi:hypothetical protein
MCDEFIPPQQESGIENVVSEIGVMHRVDERGDQYVFTFRLSVASKQNERDIGVAASVA